MHDLNAQLDFPKRKGPHDRTSHVVLNVLVGGSGLGARSTYLSTQYQLSCIIEVIRRIRRCLRRGEEMRKAGPWPMGDADGRQSPHGITIPVSYTVNKPSDDSQRRCDKGLCASSHWATARGAAGAAPRARESFVIGGSGLGARTRSYLSTIMYQELLYALRSISTSSTPL